MVYTEKLQASQSYRLRPYSRNEKEDRKERREEREKRGPPHTVTGGSAMEEQALG